MPSYKNNALVLNPDGSGFVTTVYDKTDIEKLVGDARLHLQMIHFGNHPINFECLDRDPTGASSTESVKTVVWFIRNTVTRGLQLPAADPMDYDFHRITSPEQVQMFIHDEGALAHENRPYNVWFSHSNQTRGTQPIYGVCVILGQCIDEIPYEVEN